MLSTLLDAQQITRNFSARTVLDAVDIGVSAGDRIGLVGATALQVNAAACACRSRNARPGCRPTFRHGRLPSQFADLRDRGLTVREVVLDQVGLVTAVGALDRWAGALAAGDLRAVDPCCGSGVVACPGGRGRGRAARCGGDRSWARTRVPRAAGGHVVRGASCARGTRGAPGRAL